MAVAFDALGGTTTGTVVDTGTSITWNHVNAGDFLEVTVGSKTDGVTLGVTFNGTSMTSVAKVHYNNGTVGFLERFKLANAVSGTHAVVVTASGAAWMVGASTSWSGVDTTTPVAHVATGFGNGLSASLAVTSASGNAVSWGCSSGDTVSTANQTERWNYAQFGGPNSANQSAAGASSVTGSWAINDDDYAIIGFDIVATGGGGSAVVQRSTLSPIGTRVGSRQSQ